MNPFCKFRFRRWSRRWGAVCLGLGLAWMLTWFALPHRSGQAMPPPRQEMALTQQALDLEQLVEQGRQLYQSRRVAEAVTAWQSALERYRHQGDRPAQIQVRNYLGAAHHQLGQIEQAQALLATNLADLETLKTLGVEPAARLQAQTFNTTGTLQLAQGDAEAALQSWQEAEKFYQLDQDPLGQTGSLINQAQAWQALGFFWQANRTLTQVKQQLQATSDVQLQVTGLRTLGNTLRLMGNTSESAAVLQQGLAIARQAGAADQIGAVLLSLGRTAQAQQQPQAALAYYQEAAQVAGGTQQVQAQLEQLGVLIALKDGAVATSLWPPLQARIAELPPQAQVEAQLQLIRHWMSLKQQGQPTPASSEMAAFTAEAVQTAQRLQDDQAQSQALGLLGHLYEQTQQWSDAQTLTNQALRLGQSLNAPDLEYQWQWQLGRIWRAQGEHTQALSAYELAFASLQRLQQDLGFTSAEAQFSFRDRVEPVYREFAALLLQPLDGTAPSQAALVQARQVIEALQVEELHNFFRAACLGDQLVPIDAVDQRQTVVLYPIVLPERLDIIVSLPQQPLQHYSVPVPQTELEAVLSELRQQLELPYVSPEGRQAAQQLYQWLIQPVESAWSGQRIETLVFVLDGALRNVPMASLYDGEHYLVENYSVALAPGLQLVNPQPLGQRNLRTLAAGVSEARSGFSPLINVPQELNQLQAEMPSRVLLDQQFTSQALGGAIAATPVSIVHLATHGQFSSNANETFILAWDGPIQLQALNTLLRRSDETRPNPIELLVLSACETAAGDDRAALGLAGVAVQAGARSTLASLWSIDDESSTRLMGHFYQALAQGNSKATALRQAQMALLQDPDYRAPLHWASYVLVGNWL